MNKLLLVSFFIPLLFMGCRKNETVTMPPPNPTPQNPNPAVAKPVANAGTDTTIQYPANTVLLNGHLSTGSPFQISWREITGRLGSNISETNSLTPKLWFWSSGTYSYELKLENSGGISLDTVVVTVADFGFCGGTRTQVPAELIYLTELPGQLLQSDMVALGNKLFFTQEDSNLVGILDLTTKAWDSAPLSAARDGIAMIAAGDKLFFAGGASFLSSVSSEIFFPTVDIYHASTNSWTTAQLSEPRMNCKAAVVGNKVLFAGGLKSGFVMSNKVDIYDLSTNIWSSTTLPGPGRVVQAAVSSSTKVFFCGGYSSFEDLNGFGYIYSSPVQNIDVYDVVSGQWTKDTMQLNKADFSAIAFSDKIYLAGGTYNSIETRHVETIDMITNTRTYHCLNQPTSYGINVKTATNRNGQLLFFSGYSSDRNAFDIYNPSTNTWSVGKFPAGILDNYDRPANIVSANNKTYVVVNGKLYELVF
jgi:hypothetical protein